MKCSLNIHLAGRFTRKLSLKTKLVRLTRNKTTVCYTILITPCTNKWG